MTMAISAERLHLRRELGAHLSHLGYSAGRTSRSGLSVPEIVRVNPVRGRLAYGEIVSRDDLRRQACHERLLLFSRRRTRHRSSILFFIGVAEADQPKLEALLQELEIRNGVRGGHVHVVSIPTPRPARRKPPAVDARSQAARAEP